jgi:hypothetical protein
VEIQPLLTVRLKGGKTELMSGEAQTQTCVHSLFSLLGYEPCWLLARHAKEQVHL